MSNGAATMMPNRYVVAEQQRVAALARRSGPISSGSRRTSVRSGERRNSGEFRYHEQEFTIQGTRANSATYRVPRRNDMTAPDMTSTVALRAAVTPRSPWLARWRTVWGIDVRSLAAFRMLIATTILLDVIWRIVYVGPFLTDDGILPRVVRMEMTAPHDPRGYDIVWSLHYFSGQSWGQVLLLAVAGIWAVWLLIGYRTQLAVLGCSILLLSVDNHNPLVHDAGDGVLRSLLLWANFLPLGARWSVDAWQIGNQRLTSDHVRSPLATSTPVVFSFGSAAILLQLLTVYFSAALYKMHPVWTRELSAVYYALNCDAFATRGGLFLRQFPIVMQWLTAGTIGLELLGPLLLLSPWGTRWLRCAVPASFILLHLGLAATMVLGLFPWICIAGWLLFVPSAVWEAVENARRRWAGRVAHVRFFVRAAAAAEQLGGVARRIGLAHRAEVPPLQRCWCRDSLAAALLVYASVWNLLDLLAEPTKDRLVPARFNYPAIALGLEKGWSMFAPVPHRDDGWPIFRGTLQDGTEVNLWEPGRPLPWDKPAVVSDLYHSQRWLRCLENLMAESQAWHRPYFADWLQRRWNDNFSEGRPGRRVATVEILRRLEPTPPPGEPFLPVETVTLWTKWYPPEAVDTDRSTNSINPTPSP